MNDEARILLAQDGCLPSNIFNHDIRASWRRCFESGLDPFANPRSERVDESALSAMREENELVRRLAIMEMENLHNQIAGSNFVIIFAGSDGVILDSMYEKISSARDKWCDIAPGFIWAEEINGTNALGLVRANGRPAIVHGSEHYFRKYTGLTCAAVPIYGPGNKMVGIIDASSDCRSRQRHTLALVKMSCLTIENSLFRDRYWDKLIVEFHNRHEFLGTLQSGMLAFDEAGSLVEANRQARYILQGISLKPGVHFDNIFRTPFRDFLLSLYRSSLVQLTDAKGSSLSVKAFNFHPRKFVVKPVSRNSSRRIGSKLDMICDDPSVAAGISLVERAVRLKAPILIQGETGTGKDLLARYAHIASGRTGDFVSINCAALPETLMESELFGYTDGAFTGASKGGSVGLVHQADRGTLFLDEIGVMPVQLQAKVLQFLDRWQVRPVGGKQGHSLDIQLVSATNTNLYEAVRSGKFRADLLYRINTVEVVLPPLRERSDFHLIVEAILNTFDPPLHIEQEALALLADYEWPGNVRELRSVLTRLLIGADSGVIRVEEVKDMLCVLSPDMEERSRARNLADQERDIVLAAYARHKGNISAVARELSISRNTVYKKLKEARSPGLPA